MPHRAGTLAKISTEIGRAGAVIGDLDDRPHGQRSTACATSRSRRNGADVAALAKAIEAAVPGTRVAIVPDRTVEFHEGGKLRIVPSEARARPWPTCGWPTPRASRRSAREVAHDDEALRRYTSVGKERPRALRREPRARARRPRAPGRDPRPRGEVDLLLGVRRAERPRVRARRRATWDASSSCAAPCARTTPRSTSRTSRPRAASSSRRASRTSWASPCSTTTATGPPSSRPARSSPRSGRRGCDLRPARRRPDRARRRGLHDPRAAHRAGPQGRRRLRPERARRRAGARSSAPRFVETPKEVLRGGRRRRGGHGPRGTHPQGLGAPGADRLRADEPSPRDPPRRRARGRRGARLRGRRDQQRARLPRPHEAGRSTPGPCASRGDEDRRRARPRPARERRRPAALALPARAPPRRRAGRGGRRARRGGRRGRGSTARTPLAPHAPGRRPPREPRGRRARARHAGARRLRLRPRARCVVLVYVPVALTVPWSTCSFPAVLRPKPASTRVDLRRLPRVGSVPRGSAPLLPWLWWGAGCLARDDPGADAPPARGRGASAPRASGPRLRGHAGATRGSTRRSSSSSRPSSTSSSQRGGLPIHVSASIRGAGRPLGLDFVAFEAVYFLQFLSIEYFFRGFMVLGLKPVARAARRSS